MVDEELLRRLPLPLAQLYRRAHNAKTPQDRHHAAYYLWEAALKLLGSIAIVKYTELEDQDPELAECLQNLARPSLGHWWEFVRRLVPVLANAGDPGFATMRETLLGRSRDDLPHAAGLDAVLIQVLEGRVGGDAKTTVRLTELFDRLVRYRNQEFGHGAVGQKPAALYDRVGRALLAGIPDVLSRLDVLVGHRLVYVADVRRQSSGRWLVERFELQGEASRRLESLDLADGETIRRLLPDQLYLESTPVETTLHREGVSTEKPGPSAPLTEREAIAFVSLHPLMIYEADNNEAFFLNARRGRQRIAYLSYNSGREMEHANLCDEQRMLLTRILQISVDAPSIAEWSARSQAEDRLPDLPEDQPLTPRRLGDFELLSELGRGAMGVVYRAWQPSLGRQVAVKALYRTGDAKSEARFAREIRALGRVENPYLVKIFTSGCEADQWFYAMELIEGSTLAAVCDKLQSYGTNPQTLDLQAWQHAVSTVRDEVRQAEKTLSTQPIPGRAIAPAHRVEASAFPLDARHSPLRVGRSYVRQMVELTKQVADAVDALHEHGILHRDIKPGNIMVTADGKQAALMDLGLAQIADEVDGRLTKTRQFVGTLRYASPEQILAVGGLDRRSDVYSLGATLWELLTLRPMFNATEKTPTPDLMRRIQVDEPERPRRYHPGLSRDLEAIVLKCLEKKVSDRYATARELVRDLERYQTGEAVQARPIGNLQRAWRWCRRNTVVAGLVGALATVIFCTLLMRPDSALVDLFLAVLAAIIFGSLAGLTALYLKAERQRQIAQRREQEARSLTQFYETQILAAARPKGYWGGAGKDATLKDILDHAAPMIDDAFRGQPELESSIRHALGMTYYHLGEFEAAKPHLVKSYTIRSQVLGPDHRETLAGLVDLALEQWKQGSLEEAVADGRTAFEGLRRVLGPEHEDTLWAQLNLGLFLQQQHKLDEAEPILSDAVESCRRTLGPDHHHTLYGQNDFSILLWLKGQHEKSLALDRRTLDARRRSLGSEHPDTLRSMGNLAFCLHMIGDLDEAEALYRHSLGIKRRVLGDEHEETLWDVKRLGDLLADKGEYLEGEKLLRDCLRIERISRGPEHLEVCDTEALLGSLLSDSDRPAEAEPLLRHCVRIREQKLPPSNRRLLNARSLLGGALVGQGKFAEAEPLLLDAYNGLRCTSGMAPKLLLDACDRIVNLYEACDKPEQADAWRLKRPAITM